MVTIRNEKVRGSNPLGSTILTINVLGFRWPILTTDSYNTSKIGQGCSRPFKIASTSTTLDRYRPSGLGGDRLSWSRPEPVSFITPKPLGACGGPGREESARRNCADLVRPKDS